MTSDQLVAAARDLAPCWQARAEADPAARRLPNETVDELRASGLLRVLQARRNGGHEADLTTHLEVVSAIAEGCPSTAWVVGVVHAHSWMLSHYPVEAQDDVYGADPDALVSAVIRARGRAEKVDGGYRLSGFWPFGSGSEHAQWLLLGGQIVDPAGGDGAARVIDEGDLLVPAGDVELADDWFVEGLQATGSCSIKADGVFVPEHRFLSIAALGAGQTPGSDAHGDGWLHRAASVPVLAFALTGAAIGTARAALAEFLAVVPNRSVNYAPPLAAASSLRPGPLRPVDIAQADWPTTHRMVGDAAIRIDEAELLLRRSAASIDDHARRGEPMAKELRARVRMDCGEAVHRCLEAVDMLYLATGGSGLRSTNRIGRLLRDLQAMNMHALLGIELNREMYGRILLGHEAPLV
jgi:3-hydroxy-9,10-secoandrosta-1,3,5(10)-triene-9,17-dione monooxygenase